MIRLQLEMDASAAAARATRRTCGSAPGTGQQCFASPIGPGFRRTAASLGYFSQPGGTARQNEHLNSATCETIESAGVSLGRFTRLFRRAHPGRNRRAARAGA